MILQGNRCYLRDPMPEDIKDYEIWYQPNQEWLQWDAPWRSFQPADFAILKQHLSQQIQMRHSGALRHRLEICTNNHHHIGWVSSYYINQDPRFLAIGIDIVPPAYRSRGYGEEAYVLYIQYLLANQIPAIYTQTWSGNLRMMKLAQATCFVEVYRRWRCYQVQGYLYDEITYQLHIPAFCQRFTQSARQ